MHETHYTDGSGPICDIWFGDNFNEKTTTNPDEVTCRLCGDLLKTAEYRKGLS